MKAPMSENHKQTLQKYKEGIPVQMEDFVDAVIDETTETEFNWKLVRERDGLTKQSKDIIWVEWGEDGRGKKDYKDIAIGRSLLMSPLALNYTWMTTTVTQVVHMDESHIKFKTGNSTYDLFKLKN